MGNRVVVSVVGRDQIGIIARVTAILAQQQVNVLDISQTTMQELFTMIMVVDMEKCPVSLETLQEYLFVVEQEMGLKISLQHEDIFKVMHRL
ncbi:ACT domain-containing protein [Microaerobacter geothermalis]|uniref:ACT domain-containing protein n=1 Tax=Microaerobacter geothermalis TaxID=674972 RepID=UPI001F30B2A9|nr:ACT domain-containing protein [Microaerobacter geothermalis]MCF6095387.1 ACT domain-containing protein [Microaerobacter geothermalis]